MQETAPKDADDLISVVTSARADGMRLLPVGSGSMFSDRWPNAFRRLSLSGLDDVIDIDHSNLCVRVSAGVTVGDLHRQVEPAGFHWHPVGYAGGSSTIGSVVSRNDGRRNLRFGTASDNLLGAEAVLGNGNAVRMGGKMIKFQTGYSLHHSLAGAWGQLGAFTHLLLRLHPTPRAALLLEVQASVGADLALALVGLPAAGVFPAGVDFLWQPAAAQSSAKMWLVGLTAGDVAAVAARGIEVIVESMGRRVEAATYQIPVVDACGPGSYQPWRAPDVEIWDVSAGVREVLQAVTGLAQVSNGEDFEVAGGVIDGTLSLRASPSFIEKAAVSLRAAGGRPLGTDPRRTVPTSLPAFRRLKAAFDPDGVFPDWGRDR